MKTIRVFLMLTLSVTALTSCRRSSDKILEDTRSAGRHVGRGVRALGGKHGDSRQVHSPNEFLCVEESDCPKNEQEFIPLKDYECQNDQAIGDFVTRQPRETPGEPGSSIPNIDAFQDPASDGHLAAIFRNIHFDYNSSLIKGSDNLMIIREISDYLSKHPYTYLFVEGHCDSRGPAAYNLALGSHRANAVRNLLIQEGANPDHVFTVSYGKERPLILGENEEAWRQNRRSEFKVYEQ